MSTIHPFHALRPTPTVASRVAAVPYDVVNADEARELADGNPLSFLHASRAEIGLPPHTDAYADAVYQAAAAAFARIRREAPLVVEDTPSVYFYRLRMDAHEQTGVAACFSVDEYDHDLIKKHERTRRDKEDDRTRHIVALRAQTGPVFLTYRATAEVDAAAARTAATAPLIDFTADDGIQHTVWRVQGAEAGDLVRAYARIPALYIADGHHRAASASRARAELHDRAHGPDPTAEYNTFLAVAFPHDQMQILPYNRIVKDLAGLTPAAFLEAVRSRFTTTAGGPATPARKGDIGMYLGGQWYTLRSPHAPGSGADPIASLDVSILQDRLLEPVLQIRDVRIDKRIDFVGGIRGTRALEALVDKGTAAVAFSMYPVSVDELMAIADSGAIMPPKSTWFEPKLRDGLLIHTI